MLYVFVLPLMTVIFQDNSLRFLSNSVLRPRDIMYVRAKLHSDVTVSFLNLTQTLVWEVMFLHVEKKKYSYTILSNRDSKQFIVRLP